MEAGTAHGKVYIGMGGWELFPFNRLFYPPQPGKGFRKLAFYSQFFNCVEVNATFYNSALAPQHARRWVHDVAANREFLFTVKLFKGFTHTLTATKEDLLAVHRLLAVLADAGKLGGVVVQFPYSFTNCSERRQYLLMLSKALQPHRLFLEVRHRSWNMPLMYNFFQENKLHLVNVDLPPMKEHMPFTMLSWNGAAYFRMMGRNTATWVSPWRLENDGNHVVSDRYLYDYSAVELDDLFRRIEAVRPSAQSTFVVFHNDPEANSLVNGFQLRHLVKRKQRVLVPGSFVKRFPLLQPISASVNSAHPLFADL